MNEWERLLGCEHSVSRSKVRLRPTEHPNAQPASWRCPGQRKEGHGKFFHSVPSSSPSVMDATAQTMSVQSEAVLDVIRTALTGKHKIRTQEVLTDLPVLSEMYEVPETRELIDQYQTDEYAFVPGGLLASLHKHYDRLWSVCLEEAYRDSKLPDYTPQETLDALNDLLLSTHLNMWNGRGLDEIDLRYIVQQSHPNSASDQGHA